MQPQLVIWKRFIRSLSGVCSHSKAHNFAQESLIEKIKVPFWSAINVFSGGILISVSTKCGKWLVYAETVTYSHCRINMSEDEWMHQLTFSQSPHCQLTGVMQWYCETLKVEFPEEQGTKKIYSTYERAGFPRYINIRHTNKEKQWAVASYITYIVVHLMYNNVIVVVMQ